MGLPPPPGQHPLIGRRFGSYVVEKLIGAGGMGAVYRAVQPEIGKQVAVKFLSAELSQHRELVQRFFAEARAVNLIQHDNIVDIFDFGQQDGHSFFVMELLKGRSLERVLEEEGQLSVGRTIDIALQMADALVAAHAIGIIHRDLKPDNIYLVTRAQRPDFVKLLDFGIAKLTDPGMAGMSKTMTGAIMGTPGYMPPEQGTGSPIDHRSDVFAFGVILFRMLAGRLPFEGENHMVILNQQLTRDPPDVRQYRPDVSPSLAALIRQMIARTPNLRPQSMAEVAQRLAPEMPQNYGRPPSGVVPLAPPSQPVPLVNVRAPGPAPAQLPRKRTASSPDMPTVQSPSWHGGPTSGALQSPTTLSSATGQEISRELKAMGLPTPGRTLKITVAAAVLFAGGIGALAFAIFHGHDEPAAPAKLPAAQPTEPAAPPPAAPSKNFKVLVETEPSGAQVVSGSKLLGHTPLKLTLANDPTEIALSLSGFREEKLSLQRDTEHAFVRLRPRSSTAKPKAPAAPAPAKKKPSIGLDD